jgi:tRNA pseudouridine55 synthase
MHGALLVDKPSGPTSHDIVAFTRRLLNTPRVGHTGTLDPLATGLLILLVGHATRLAQFLVTDEKEYLADIRLGISTPTYDAQSLEEAVRLKPEAWQPAHAGPSGSRLQAEDLTRVLPDFLGTFPQLPPPYSAKKIAGTRAYEKARRNEPVDLKPVEVTVHELELIEPRASDVPPRTSDLIRLRIVCSAGFYVRSLAHDIGQVLGCGAHLEGLRRTRAGRFRVEDAATLDVLEAAGRAAAERLIPLNSLLSDFPAVTLTEEGLRRASNGNSLALHHVSDGVLTAGPGARVRVLGPSGEVLAGAERRSDGLLHPLLVLR